MKPGPGTKKSPRQPVARRRKPPNLFAALAAHVALPTPFGSGGVQRPALERMELGNVTLAPDTQIEVNLLGTAHALLRASGCSLV